MKLGRTTPILRDALDDFHRELTGKAYKYARPGVEHMPWGSREMTLLDPFGNRLTFTMPASQKRGD